MSNEEYLHELNVTLQGIALQLINTNNELIKTKDTYDAIISAMVTEIANLSNEPRDRIVQRLTSKVPNCNDFLKVVK